MAREIIMPKQGLQMTEGLITRWLAAEGGKIVEGEPLFEMETDKLAITIDSPVTGTLIKILCQEGESAPVASVIAWAGEAGETVEAAAAPSAAERSAAELSKTAPAKAAPAWSEAVTAKAETAARTGVERLPTLEGERLPPLRARSAGRIFATPRARMRAAEVGAEPEELIGSGPDGLIVERDVLNYAAGARRAFEKAAREGKPVARYSEARGDIQVLKAKADISSSRSLLAALNAGPGALVLRCARAIIGDYAEFTVDGRAGVALCSRPGAPTLRDIARMSLCELSDALTNAAVGGDECALAFAESALSEAVTMPGPRVAALTAAADDGALTLALAFDSGRISLARAEEFLTRLAALLRNPALAMA